MTADYGGGAGTERPVASPGDPNKRIGAGGCGPFSYWRANAPYSHMRRSSALDDVTAATFLDVAVIRCLFVPRWCEEGVHWALQFLFYRSVVLKSI